VIANSGCANAFTGKKGMDDARWMAGILAQKLKCSLMNRVASTGVIGRNLDRTWIGGHLDEVFKNLSDTEDSGKAAARAIMTTDTTMKEIAIELNNGVRIAGISKGSGMIEPNMGTMLAFYTLMRNCREITGYMPEKAADKSFNMVVVDGDTSTNDMALLTATGYHDAKKKHSRKGLTMCVSALQNDRKRREGATRLIEVRVTGAMSMEDARKAAKAISRSPLVKTAIFGKDPNWGK